MSELVDILADKTAYRKRASNARSVPESSLDGMLKAREAKVKDIFDYSGQRKIATYM